MDAPAAQAKAWSAGGAAPPPGRWWLDPALARLAFDSERPAGKTPSISIASAMFNALRADDLEALDLDDPAQRAFGDYELLERIGHGGVGIVFRAREQRLDRDVALKLLSAGSWAPEPLVTGLRREARHAAQLQHANIVTVFGMGEHDGLIYYAMQLVRGRSLSQRIDEDGPLPPKDAARLLRTIAEAVDYAHRLGVLHLDLKPGNILQDSNGSPLVTDFGLARRIEQALVRDDIAGTPSYMAPEQARTDGPPLSPATDVWSLGAVLFEALTGHPPFEGNSATDTLRLVLEGQVRRLRRYRPVPHDLEAICLHCLRKAPQDRYPDARQLADDLGPFLEGRAVHVRPLNTPQRMWRWSRREPRLATALGTPFLALTIGLGTAVVQWRNARQSAELAREINQFLNKDVLAAANPYLHETGDMQRMTIPSLLKDAEAKLDRGVLKHPAARAEIGLTLGRAYFGMGLWPQAWNRLEKALRDAQLGAGTDAPLTLDIEQDLGLTAIYAGEYSRAGEIYGHLVGTRKRLHGWDAPETIAARRGEALLLFETDRFDSAKAAFESAQDAAAQRAPDQLHDIQWTLSEIYAELNHWDESEALVRRALAQSRQQLGPMHPQYLWESTTLGDLLNMRGQWDEATQVISAAHSGLLQTVGSRHPKTITTLHYLGQIALWRGRPAEALPLLQAAAQQRLEVHGPAHKYTHFSMNRVGEALIALRRPQEAVVVLDEVLALATRSGQRESAYVLLILDNLARAHLMLSQPQRAEALLHEANLRARTRLPPQNIRLAWLARSLGELREQQGRPDQAIGHYRDAERIFAGLRPQHPWAVEMRQRLQAMDSTAAHRASTLH